MSECYWGQGECVPNCPSCKRMDDLYAERVAGFKEGIDAARAAVAALPHDTYCVTRDENYNRPCNCLRDEALAVIEELKEN